MTVLGRIRWVNPSPPEEALLRRCRRLAFGAAAGFSSGASVRMEQIVGAPGPEQSHPPGMTPKPAPLELAA